MAVGRGRNKAEQADLSGQGLIYEAHWKKRPVNEHTVLVQRITLYSPVVFPFCFVCLLALITWVIVKFSISWGWWHLAFNFVLVVATIADDSIYGGMWRCFSCVLPDVSKERSTLISKGSAIVPEGLNCQKHQSGNVNIVKLLLTNIFSGQFRKFENVRNYVRGCLELKETEGSV